MRHILKLTKGRKTRPMKEVTYHMRQWLVDIRDSKKLTQSQVAKLADISRSYYSEIENGTKDPSVKTAKKIASSLGFDWTIFFKDAGRITRQNKTKQSA